jgi:iron complex outermembrane receptor protein
MSPVHKKTRGLKNSTYLTTSAMALAVLLSAGGEALAQSFGTLEEITVTSQRRAENLQSVPISVTAVTSEALRATETNYMLQIERVAPSLKIYQIGAAAIPFLRGIGSSQSSHGFESPVAIYIDGVYAGSKQGNIFDLPNIERIEVLKGPQGTLFGRNATAGALNIVTKDPSGDLEGNISVGYGRFDEKKASAYLSGAISDTLAVNASFTGRWDDGYIYNTTLNRMQNPTNSMTGTGKVVWTPTDDFKASFSAIYSYIDDPTGTSHHALPGTLPTWAAAGFTTTYNPRETTSNHQTYATNKATRLALNLEYDLDDVKLVSITGYANTSSRSLSESDITDGAKAYSGAIQPGDQISQEFQIQSNNSSALEWIVGTYYMFLDEAFGDNGRNLVSASNVPSPIRPIDIANGGVVTAFESLIRTNAYAAFGQASYKITDDARLTLGLRYNEEKKRIDGEIFRYTAVPYTGDIGEALYNTELGPELLSFGRNTLATANLAKSYTKLTWRAAFDYQFSDDLMAFVSYNRGFKSGTFNPTSVSPTAEPLNPEILDAFEVGLKSELFDRRVRFNAAAFYYDYKNIQVGLITGSGISTVQNAAGAKVKGLEFDMQASATENLNLRLAVNFLDSKYNYPNAQVFIPKVSADPCPTPPPSINMDQARAIAAMTPVGGNCSYSLDATGQRIVFAPKVTGNAGFDYNIPMANGSRVVLSGSAYYTSSYDVVPGGIFGRVGSYWMLSAAATYYSEDDRYFVRLWGDNLANEKYSRYISNQALGVQEVSARPISYGVSVGFRFGS